MIGVVFKEVNEHVDPLVTLPRGSNVPVRCRGLSPAEAEALGLVEILQAVRMKSLLPSLERYAWFPPGTLTGSVGRDALKPKCAQLCALVQSSAPRTASTST